MFDIFQRRSSRYHLFTNVRRGNVRLTSKYLDMGVPVDALDGADRTALCLAAKYGKVEVIRLLAQRGADLNFRGKYGRTPIFNAIYAGHIEAVRLLVELGADLTVRDGAGYTPYDYAAASSALSVLQLLKVDGPDGRATSEATSTEKVT
jgi:ankyrin repeat protein